MRTPLSHSFTVSMLLSELSFADDPTHVDEAKAAVLVASLLSAVIGGLVVSLRSRVHHRRRSEALSDSPPDAPHPSPLG